MKFIPILFSTQMVQAILDGRKTQTRRVLPEKSTALQWLNDGFTPEFILSDGNDGVRKYNVGDILWVRESCFWDGDTNFTDISPIGSWYYKADESGFSPKWKPSIHMPKEACRLFLKITNVRVERLQDISDNDAIKEGVKIPSYGTFKNYIGGTILRRAKESFQSLWQSINGEQSWNDNPWVWVIEFEPIEKPKNFI